MTDTQKAALRKPEYSKTVLSFLSHRRSNLAKLMIEPGPDPDTLHDILTIAARVPDHRKLAPWRFIIFSGEARRDFGRHIEARFKEQTPEATPERTVFEAERLMRAPVVVAVISSPKVCKRGTPTWEQTLSAGAVGLNMLLAAQASGFAAQWLTEWIAYDDYIAQVLGLAEPERIAGFVYMGTAEQAPLARKRPNMTEIISYWSQV